MHLKDGSNQATGAGRLPARNRTAALGQRVFSVLLLVLASAWALPALADGTTAALQDTTCAGQRDGSALLCTAGEFTVDAVVQEATGTLPTCTIGGTAEIDIRVHLIGSNADRFDAGLFIGQASNDPKQTTGVCSVATFPETPTPFSDLDNATQPTDTCGDYLANGDSFLNVTGVKVACLFGTDPANTTTYGKLLLPYTLTYWQNSGNVCTGPDVVTSGSKSKCNAGVGSISGVTLSGFLAITKQTVPDGDTTSFNFTASNTRGPLPPEDAAFTLQDGATHTIPVVVDTTTQTVTVTESSTVGWNDTATISCLDYLGNATTGYVTTNGTTRTITAALDLQHPAVACTITNVKGVPLTLNKTWVNANVGDTATLTTTGGTSNVNFLSTAGSANETDTASPVIVIPGDVITLAEAVPASANYTSALQCTGTTGLSGNVLTVGPTDTAINCTFTNNRRSAQLTLAKIWSNAVVGDAVTISTSGAVNNDSFSPVAGAPSTSYTDSTPVTVFAGEQITFSELFTTGLPGDYVTSLACTGTTGLSGSVLTVGPADTAITCSYTNARAPISLTLRKQWQNAIVGNAVTVSASGGLNPASLNSTATTPNQLDTAVAPVEVFAGETITIGEVFTSGVQPNYIASVACTGNQAPLVGNTLTVTAGDGPIVCTETNARRSATLVLQKTWVNAVPTNAVNVTGTGGIVPASLSSTAATANETDANGGSLVYAGEQITIAENFTSGNAANYTASLACSGNSNQLSGNVLTVAFTDTAITCTETNTRAAGTLTLAKTWVNAVPTNAVTVSGTGGTTPATLNSVAGTPNETDTGAPVAISTGDVITIAESFTSGSAANYSASLSCTGMGAGTTLVGNVLTVGATPGSVTCTETNARAAGTLTLAKNWINAALTDAVTVTGTGGTTPATLASVAGTPNELDTGAPAVISTGDVITINESFTSGNPANYSASLSCSGMGAGTTLVGNVLTVGAVPGAVTCTETNARAAGTLQVAKTWVNAALTDAVNVSATGGANSATVASVAGTANETDAGTPVAVSAGEIFTIGESFTSGSAANYSSGLSCTGLGNGTTLVGNVLTIGPTPGAIVCTQTNTRAAGTLQVAKAWVNAALTNAVTVTASGGANTATVASVADAANETDAGTPVTASAGEVFTITESFTSGSAGNYTASLACTGLGEGTTLVGNVLTIGATPGAIVCTQTNTRSAGTLTIAKRWVDAHLTDAVTVSATGGANPATLASVANSATETDTGAPVAVSAGEVYTISESFTSGAAANYVSSLACTSLGNGPAPLLAGNVLTIGATPGNIVCTEINTRRSARLTLSKTWANAVVGNAVTVDANSNEAGLRSSLASSAGAASETDTGTPVTVYAGEVLSFSESFTAGSVGNYAAALACTGNANAVAGTSVTVGASDTALSCGFTNTRVATTLTLRKTWVNATPTNAVTVSATGGANPATLASVANTANETDTGTPVSVLVGETITIGEAFTAGSAANYTSSLACTGNTAPLAGNVLTVSRGDAAIVCTETNSRILRPLLNVTKTATPTTFIVGQPAAYTVTVTNGGEAATSGTITLADPLPAGISLVSASGAGWTCAGTTSVSCTYAGSLAVGASAAVTFNVSVGPTATNGNNTATASGGGDATCPAAGHCAGTVQVPVQPAGPSLSIVKSANPVRVNAGALVLYTLQVTNIVNYNVTNAQVRDLPPNGLAYVPGSGTIYDANPANNAVSGARPIVFSGVDVAVGQTIRIQYLLRAGAALAAGEYTNSAQAFQDGRPTSNIATFTVYAETGADPLLEQTRILGKVFDDQNGNGWQDAGERGVPGVRIASVNGLVSETDAHGRYHQEGIVLLNQERGMNYVLKLDRASLPPGTKITTENPLLRRITAAIPARFDFGVKLPPMPAASAKQEDLALGEINFTPGSTEIRPEYLGVLDRMAGEIHAHQSGEVFIDSASGNSPLAFERAGKVRDELVNRLSPEERNAFTITVRLQAADGTTGTVGLTDEVLLGQVFFDTDKSTIRPEFEGLLDKIAANIESVGSGRVSIVGHADLRASTEYNQALGMRRANSVYDAIAKRLSPEARTKLSVDVEGAVVAPGAGQ